MTRNLSSGQELHQSSSYRKLFCVHRLFSSPKSDIFLTIDGQLAVRFCSSWLTMQIEGEYGAHQRETQVLKRKKMRKYKIKIQRKLLAVLMESPFYFNIPPQRRLEFIEFFSQQSVYDLVCKYNQNLINSKSDSKQQTS